MLSSFLKLRVWSKLFELPRISIPIDQAALAKMRSQDPLIWIDCEVSRGHETFTACKANKRSR